jgi:hypothetical protein
MKKILEIGKILTALYDYIQKAMAYRVYPDHHDRFIF